MTRPPIGAKVRIPGSTATVRLLRYIEHTGDVLVRYGNGATGTKTLQQLHITD